VDRCLSPRLAVGIGRFTQLTGVSLAQVFTTASATEDEQFLGAAGEAGWAVFTQNDLMLRNPAQMAVIRDHSTQVFTLTNSQLGTEGSGLVFGRWLVTIRRRMAKSGPCFWRLYEDRKTHDIH
jgi:PIN like domain